MAKDRPGMMIYFDLIEPLEELAADEIGEFILAVLYYGRDGVEPDFSGNGMLRMLWKTEKPRCDRGKEKYTETVEARKYAAFCREYQKQHEGATPPSMEQWKKQLISSDIKSNEQEQEQKQEIKQNEKKNEIRKGVQGETSQPPGEAGELFREWLDALDEGRRLDAADLSNRLFRMGYEADILSRSWRGRKEHG